MDGAQMNGRASFGPYSEAPGSGKAVRHQRIAGSTNTLAQAHLLQRKCACGGTPGLDGECAECPSKRLTLQRRSTNHDGPSTVPLIVNDVLRSPGRQLDAG